MSARTQLASSSLYDTDFFAWTKEQSQLLRVLPAGRRHATLDFGNIAEEIESLGRSDLQAVESQIFNVLVHLLKMVSDPTSLARSHWRLETAEFQLALRRKYTSSMRHHIDLQKEWKTALRIADLALRGWNRTIAEGLPEACPFMLADLVADGFDVEEAEATLAASLKR